MLPAHCVLNRLHAPTFLLNSLGLLCSVIVSVGQCGNQIGCRFWDLALREHASVNKVITKVQLGEIVLHYLIFC